MDDALKGHRLASKKSLERLDLMTIVCAALCFLPQYYVPRFIHVHAAAIHPLTLEGDFHFLCIS